MTLYMLDTDIMGFAFQRHPTALQRLQHLPEDDLVVTTIITFGEGTRMDLDAFRQPLRCLFQQHPVCLAYLFGSQTTRRTHPSSDVDVAVLFDESLTPDERFAERMRLLGGLPRIFGTAMWTS
jgi:predicted nucleotidyltransferase